MEAAREAAESVQEVRDITGGTVAFGTFGSAHHYLLVSLLQDFRTQYPNVRVRAIGQNSAEVADGVREGTLEAGLVTLPIDDRGLDVRPAHARGAAVRERRCRAPARADDHRAARRAPLILYDARWGPDDPMRRQLRERAQAAGVTLEPQIEVEYVTAALELTARGLGDTVSVAAADPGQRAWPAGSPAWLRAAALRHLRLHHASQRPPVAGDPRVHPAGREAGGAERQLQTRNRG